MSYQDKLKKIREQQKIKDTKENEKDIDMPQEEQEIENEDVTSSIKDDDENNTNPLSIHDIVNEEDVENLNRLGFTIVKTTELQAIVNTNSQLMQNSQEAQKLAFKHEMLTERMRELRKLVKKFYQMEAATVASNEALQAMLKCFEGANQGLQGWPTIQVFTPDGWIKGSVDYNLHNAVLLAKTATTSENLQVVEKHLGGFNKQVKSLSQDIADLQSFIPFKVEKCSHCNKFKKVNSKCQHCGKSDSDGMDFLDDEDDEE